MMPQKPTFATLQQTCNKGSKLPLSASQYHVGATQIVRSLSAQSGHWSVLATPHRSFPEADILMYVQSFHEMM
jgi:hypothetical protein